MVVIRGIFLGTDNLAITVGQNKCVCTMAGFSFLTTDLNLNTASGSENNEDRLRHTSLSHCSSFPQWFMGKSVTTTCSYSGNSFITLTSMVSAPPRPRLKIKWMIFCFINLPAGCLATTDQTN